VGVNLDVRDFNCEADVGICLLLRFYAYEEFRTCEGYDSFVGAI
jgi:hypothetical protein